MTMEILLLPTMRCVARVKFVKFYSNFCLVSTLGPNLPMLPFAPSSTGSCDSVTKSCFSIRVFGLRAVVHSKNNCPGSSSRGTQALVLRGLVSVYTCAAALVGKVIVFSDSGSLSLRYWG